MIGSTVSHYRIVRKLGKGGMGEVYLADDVELDRKVALKFLPSELAHEEHALERFRREAKAAAALSHPNIITVHEVGVFDDQPYIAMAYVEGRPLSHDIRERPLCVSRAIKIACQICDGLAEAHKHGVVHRDIKPENVHIDRSDRVRILDFGLAMRHELPTITREDTAVGTISYMSPEQAAGDRVDHRSDLFSLGTVLYEMLTGRRPFDGPHPAAVLYAIAHKTPEPIRNLNAAVGEGLARIVDTALQKDPDQRFASAEDMGAALRAARSAAERRQRAKDRRQRSVITIAGSAVLLAGLVFYTPRLMSRDRVIENSLAVLPLANLSGDSQQDFFAEGMTEAVITRLAQIKALRVISRTSVMRYRGTDKPVAEISNELGVGLIVQGAVTRTGDKVRVTAQLIDAKTDTHIWAGTYNAVGASDIIALQSTIATEIAQEVSVHVTADERTRLSAYHPTNPEAYESFLQGRYHLNRRTPRDLALAADFFDRAIELDSTFAPAFAGIADCYAVRAMWNWDTSQNTFPRARHACEAALRADPNLADAYASLAMVQLFYDWDWTSAEKSFRKAIALNPNYAIAYHWYGLALMSLGRYDEAIRRQKQAVDLDPFSPIMLATLGQAYDMNGQYELASECVDRAFDVFPTFGYAALAKSWIAYHQEHYSEAVEYSKKALELKVDRAEVMLVAGLIKQGDQVGAKLALEEGLARGAPYHVRAALYAYYGDMQHAFEMAQLAVEAREWFVVAFRSRWMEPLREHPMFDDLLNNAAAIK